MGLLKEFKEFAMRGNVVDMAVGIVIGGAFGKIVSSLVGDVIMPSVGALTGGIDFSEAKCKVSDAVMEGEKVVKEAVYVNYGVFLNTIIDFVIMAFAIFMVIKAMNAAKKRFDQEQPEAAPAAPPEDIVLLREIRDALQK